MTGVLDTLESRAPLYGRFDQQARLAQDFKNVLHGCPRWYNLTADQREALEMIATKMARILNGDPNYPDSWHDISGYAQLVEMRLTNIGGAS